MGLLLTKLMVDIIGSHYLYILPPTPSTPEPSETEGRQMKWMHHLMNGKKITKACHLNLRFSLPEMLNPKSQQENDDKHWIGKMMMIFQRYERNAMHRDWVNASVLGPFQHQIPKASCMPFVKTFDQRNSKKELPFVWNFKTPSIIVRNINVSFKTPAIF